MTEHASDGTVVVIIPTYNEASTIATAVGRVREHLPEAHVLVVDDNSPDGTGEIAEDLAAKDAQVSVIHRAGKEGLGRAYVHGFAMALEARFDFIVEMDADGSHRAIDLPRLIERARAGDHPDLVIGSRWVDGGEVENWSLPRQLLSRGGNTYTRAMLGLPVRDATAGFRVYRADLLRRLDLASVESAGYCFQVDMTWRTHRAGGTIAEVPIVFVEREDGESKMSQGIVLEALQRTTQWGIKHRAGQIGHGVSRLLGRHS